MRGLQGKISACENAMNLIIDKFRAIRIWGVRGLIEACVRMFHDYRIYKELLRNFRRNINTTPVRGITVIAPITGNMSLGKTMRDFVIRLKATGIPHQVFDTYSNNGIVRSVDYKDLITPKSEFNVLKYTHVVEMLKSPLTFKLPINRCRIAFWEGEAGILKVFPYLIDSDMIIAMSDFNELYFKREFPSPIKVAKILYPLLPISEKVLKKEDARDRFGFMSNEFIVFYNFDIRADYRKNLQGTLEAFAKAFSGCADCRLILKINGADQSAKRMENMYSDFVKLGIVNQVAVFTDYFSQEDLYSLSNACDVYLSLHRAEGFGIGIAESMLLSKAVVVTNYSGSTEFCNDSTAVLVPYKKVRIQDDGFWKYMEEWAEPDIKFAAQSLRMLYEDRGLCERLGESAKHFVESHFSLSSFADSVNNFLNENRVKCEGL